MPNSSETDSGQFTYRVVNPGPWSSLRPPQGFVFQCSSSIPTFPHAVFESKGNIYIVSPPTICSCQSRHDLHLFSTHDRTLTPITTFGTRPEALLDVAYTSGMSSDGNSFIVFASNLDVYSLDLRTKLWTRIEVHGSPLPQRSSPSIVMVNSKIFLFGGHALNVLNDLWVLDLGPSITMPSWALVDPSTMEKPCPRYGHKCFPYEHYLIIFGGYGSQHLNDIWCYDTDTRAWSQLPCTGPIPTPRFMCSVAVIHDIAYIFGGSGAANSARGNSGSTFRDLWAFDIRQQQWYLLEEGQNPQQRYNHSMVSVGDKIYVFGGSAGGTSVIDLLDTSLITHPGLRNRNQATSHQDHSPPPQYGETDSSSEIDPSTISSLLAMLQTNKSETVNNSVEEPEALDLMLELLATNNPIRLASQLDATWDTEVLLEYILDLLDQDSLSNEGLPDFNRRARRLMLRMITEWPAIPKCLLLPEISIHQGNTSQRGGLGDVIRGELRGKAVALRLLPPSSHKNFYQGALTWRTLRHEHILSVLGIYIVKSPRKARYLVTPEMENGSLSQWRKGRNVAAERTQELMLQVAKGVQYLHLKGIVHGDLRGSNVLLDHNLICKISNFGMIRQRGDPSRGSPIISPNFAAPELFNDLEVDEDLSDLEIDVQSAARTDKSDVYAFACLYYEIHFDAIPFDGISYEELATLVAKDKARPKPLETPSLSGGGWKLMRRCWRSAPGLRPTMEAIVEMMAAWDDE